MSKKRRIWVLLGLTLLLVLSTVLTVGFYYLGAPGKVKALIEQSISSATGTECSIKELSYSLNPLFLRAREIQLIDHVRNFHLDIAALVTELSLQGPFTRRILVVNHLTLQGFSLSTDYSSAFTGAAEKPEPPGFFSSLARGLVALLLFRDIRIDSAELTGGQVNGDMGEQSLTLSEIQLTLNKAQSLQISCHGRLRWPSADTELTMPHLLLTTDQAISLVDPEIRTSLKSEDMTLTTSRGKAESLSGEAQIVYDRDRKLLMFNSARLSSETLLLRHASGSDSPPVAMVFDADGFVDFSTGRAGAQRFHLILKQIMEATGGCHAETGAHPQVTLSDLVVQLTLRNALPMFAETIEITPTAFTVEGTAYVSGNLSGRLEGNEWQWQGDLQTRLKDSDVSFSSGDILGRGKVTADIQLKGLYPDVESALTCAVEKAELSDKGVGVRSAKAALTATGKGLDFVVQNLDFQTPQAEFGLSGKRVQVHDLKAKVQGGTIHFAPAKLEFPRIDLHTSLLRNLQLSVDAQEGQVIFGLEGKEVGILSFTKALSLVPADWQVEGVDSLLVRGSLNPDGHWLVESNWTLDHFAFQSPDSRHAGEKLSLGLNVSAAGERGQTKCKASVQGTAEKGGFLQDRIYVDLERNSLHVQAHGAYDLSTGTTDLSQFRLALRDLLSLEAEGQLGDFELQKPCHLRVRLPRVRIKPAFQLFVKEPFERETPFLAELGVEGDLTAEMEFQKETEGWRLLGFCSWHEGGFSGKGVAIEGIELDLPFWCEKPGTSEEASHRGKLPASKDLPKEGNLFIQSISLPFVPKQPLSLQVQSAPNLLSFTLKDPIRTPAGELALGPISLSGLSSLSPSLVTSVTLKEGDLAPLVAGLWPHPLEGSIRATLDPLHFDRDDIKARGDVRIRAFGGAIVLSNLGVSGVLSPTPALHLDATWRDLNLAELTEGTPFEKVEGILRGEVKHLEVVGGEPQRFELFMETTKTKDIPQRISVRALENISRIGGGGSPFIGLAGALTSIFKEFPYDKIAIQASLENDVFRIDGPLREGDKVYLVKRSGLSGVNVVNQDPNGRISFKDMMKRIKRVTAAQQDTTGKEETP